MSWDANLGMPPATAAVVTLGVGLAAGLLAISGVTRNRDRRIAAGLAALLAVGWLRNQQSKIATASEAQ